MRRHPTGEVPREAQTRGVGKRWFIALNRKSRTLAIYEIRQGRQLIDVTDEDFAALLRATLKTTVLQRAREMAGAYWLPLRPSRQGRQRVLSRWALGKQLI